MIIITILMFVAALLGGLPLTTKAPELLMLSRVFVGLHSGQSSGSVTHGTYPSLSLYTCLFGLYSGCITHCTHPCLSFCFYTHLFGLHSGQSSGCITDCTHLCLCVCVSLTLSLYACLFGLRSGQSSGCITAHVSLSMYVSCVCVCGWVGHLAVCLFLCGSHVCIAMTSGRSP